MASLLDKSIGEFAAELAAERPTPGGGSAAALGGALGAALVSMVCSYTTGRERYADVETEAEELLERAEGLRAALEAATVADVDAYQRYADAQKLPKEAPEEVEVREAALQEALKASTEVPLEVAERSAEAIALAEGAARIGNRYLISDAGVAASLALAAFEAAALNVELNAGGLEDVAFAEEARERLRRAGERDSLREAVDRTYATIRAGGG